MQDLEHLSPRDLDHRTDGNCHGRGRSKRFRAQQRLLAEKVTWSKKRNRRFLSSLREGGELCPATQEIKHSVGWGSLTKHNLLWRVTDTSSSRSVRREKSS